jgi:hypothetical protein
VTSESLAQDEKQWWQRISTDDGRQIDESDLHCSNADSPIRTMCDFGSNRSRERFSHRRKHFAQIVSTELGMKSDESRKQNENRPAGRLKTRQSGSKLISQRPELD